MQGDEGQHAVEVAASGVILVFNEGSNPVVQVLLFLGQLYVDVADDSLREFEFSVAAPVADHHLGQLILELILVLRLSFVDDEIGGKFALPAQLPRLKQRDQVEQLA
ncbi:hypothetical protein D3C81_1028420 [compost metagenome]